MSYKVSVYSRAVKVKPSFDDCKKISLTIPLLPKKKSADIGETLTMFMHKWSGMEKKTMCFFYASSQSQLHSK